MARQRAGNLSRLRAATRFAPVSAAILTLCLSGWLAACSGLAATGEEIPAVGPDPSYNALVARHLSGLFKDKASGYDSFEISDYRWTRTIKGWNWLTCVRFLDHGHPRVYAVYIRGNDVVDSHYAVVSDGCGTLTYLPFDAFTGANGSSSGLAPVH
jgi:hypothetical protein